MHIGACAVQKKFSGLVSFVCESIEHHILLCVVLCAFLCTALYNKKEKYAFSSHNFYTYTLE